MHEGGYINYAVSHKKARSRRSDAGARTADYVRSGPTGCPLFVDQGEHGATKTCCHIPRLNCLAMRVADLISISVDLDPVAVQFVVECFARELQFGHGGSGVALDAFQNLADDARFEAFYLMCKREQAPVGQAVRLHP